MLNAKKGLSSFQLSRDFEVNKNTAWQIAMQIRKAMTQAEHCDLMTGIVEMNESYVGGKPRLGNRRNRDKLSKRGIGTDKAPVIVRSVTWWQGDGQGGYERQDERPSHAGLRA